MSALVVAPLPPATIRLSLGPEEWEACLDAWLTLTESILRLGSSDFSLNASDHGSLPAFLSSFYRELGTLAAGDSTLSTPKANVLRKACFKIVSRIYLGDAPIPLSLLDFTFVAHFCHAHIKATALQRLLTRVWKKKGDLLAPRLQKQRDLVTASLEKKTLEDGIRLLTQLAPVMHASTDIGALFMTGSDFLDSLVSAYSHATNGEQKKATSTVLYLGLTSLLQTEPPKNSLLSDHLYTLKSHGDKSPPNQSLLADVVTNTSLLSKLRHLLGEKAPDRLFKLLDTLETYRTPSLARQKRRIRGSRGHSKGKQPASKSDLNVHQMSLVTQVQDLFPDLGSGFVMKLLDEYTDDVEQVTAHLLDDSLPSHLASLDRGEEANVEDSSPQAEVDRLVPRSTPPPPQPFIPDRRNAFDDDELDRLDFDTSRLHIGKRNKSVTAEDQPNKAAILAALAAFDSDDDERDDTYDVEDVGGTIDSQAPDGEPGPAAKVTQEENEMALFTAYKSAPDMFGRSFDIRRGQARSALKKETGMTDEQIEGWALMLQRDPKRLKRLEAQTGAFSGQQTELTSTAYHGSAGNTETEDSDAAQGGRGGFRGRGRGRGRGGRGRGGSVAGPSSDPSTANAQRKKEASKSSRANHNRRDQRAKKMARGGFAG
ncbi:Putative ubiquitin system component CUE, UBA-like superfamily [Septoria linicola]|uniref:Ubiquitin system component CUE, UBA-like superfamily n=1 Tax=Septoria linicola TaxID=215465 RepID=A0A9Q9B1T6_9PEZI|nr:putative ubiquitin system component CUE, UBA-like superfamily [Septoria linicola]USW59404.1 Putative ubiquitin system component CUE, UBA-like superfamily [Septoria linicola]